jgi:hypothetical protein
MIELWNKKAQLYGAELGQCKGGSTTQPWDIVDLRIPWNAWTSQTPLYGQILGHCKVGCTLWQRALRQQSFSSMDPLEMN